MEDQPAHDRYRRTLRRNGNCDVPAGNGKSFAAGCFIPGCRPARNSAPLFERTLSRPDLRRISYRIFSAVYLVVRNVGIKVGGFRAGLKTHCNKKLTPNPKPETRNP